MIPMIVTERGLLTRRSRSKEVRQLDSAMSATSHFHFQIARQRLIGSALAVAVCFLF
jgi:hypothetical protein